MANVTGRAPLGAWTVLSLCLPAALILLGEVGMYIGRFGICLALHLVNVVACLLLPVFLRRDPSIWQAFMLVSMVRVMDLGLPDFDINPMLRATLLYLPLVIVSALILLNSDISRRPRPLGAEISSTIRGFGRSLRASFRPRASWVVWTVAGTALAWLLANVEYAVLRSSKGFHALADPGAGIVDLAVLFVVMVFLVGLCEEMIFRYALQGTMAKAVGPAAAIGASSLIFAAMHAGQQSPDYMVVMFLMSTIIGAIYHRTRSLALVMYIHGLLNFLLFSYLPHGMLLLPGI